MEQIGKQVVLNLHVYQSAALRKASRMSHQFGENRTRERDCSKQKGKKSSNYLLLPIF